MQSIQAVEEPSWPEGSLSFEKKCVSVSLSPSFSGKTDFPLVFPSDLCTIRQQLSDFFSSRYNSVNASAYGISSFSLALSQNNSNCNIV